MLRIVLAVVMLFMLSGCSKSEMDNSKETYEYVVTDFKGYQVGFKSKPQRILPLQQGVTEVVLSMVSPDRVIAVSEEAASDASFVKQEAKQVKNITARYPSVEVISQLQPDLVLAPETYDITKVETLKQMGLRVVITSAPKDISSVKERIIFIGKVLNEQEKADEIVAYMTEKLSAVDRVKKIVGDKKKTLIAFSTEGAFGREGGLLDNLCVTAGIINGAAVSGLTKLNHLSKEQVIKVNPDYFLLPKSNDRENQKFIDEILHDPAYSNVKAIRNNNIIYLEEKYYRYNTSQYTAEAAYLLAKGVYGDYFN